MLSWVTPLWLFGLALLPLIRWLHRGGRHRRSVPVSRLKLWHGSAASLSAAGRRRPPDPAWRRRALLAALLFFALAGPQWPERRPSITVWVDDSISMLTREPLQGAGASTESNERATAVKHAAHTRLIAGLAQARVQLDQVAHGQVEVRSLSDPWHDLGPLTDAVVMTLSTGAGQSEPAAPPAALLRANSQHWLVTDGADAKLLSWPADRRPDRTIQHANVTRNVGLERLSARRNPLDPGSFELLVKLTNGGTAIETRELIVTTQAGEVSRTPHRLEPGTSMVASVTIPASEGVRAALQPVDALPSDDEIALDLASLRKRRVATDPKCPAAIATAVGTHPGLVLAPYEATDVAAMLDCGSRAAAAGLPTLRVISKHTPTQVAGPVKWSSSLAASSRITLDAGRLRTAARLQAGPTDAVLLAVGNDPIVIDRSGSSKLIETPLDFGSMSATTGPEIPLLVNLMFERLFDAPLLNSIATADRGPDAVRVAPLAVPDPPTRAPAAIAVPILRGWARPLLMAALLVLLWEIGALARQALRLREYPDGRAA